MEWYNILEADYKKSPFENWDEVFRQEGKNADALKALLETDPILMTLEGDQKEPFYRFATCCNTVAARSGGEVSVAIHPKTKESSVVIVTERLQTVSVLKNYLDTAIRLSFQFAIEPVEENGPKLMLYFNHSLV